MQSVRCSRKASRNGYLDNRLSQFRVKHHLIEYVNEVHSTISFGDIVRAHYSSAIPVLTGSVINQDNPMKISGLVLLASFSLLSAPVGAAEISTHVLDIASGEGGADVPVTLFQRDAAGSWIVVGTARTDAKGRVSTFAAGRDFAPGVYRLHFDMAEHPDAKASPFFPEIAVTFNVSSETGHYHVPVVVSPYGYSSYRGN